MAVSDPTETPDVLPEAVTEPQDVVHADGWEKDITVGKDVPSTEIAPSVPVPQGRLAATRWRSRALVTS